MSLILIFAIVTASIGAILLIIGIILSWKSAELHHLVPIGPIGVLLSLVGFGPLACEISQKETVEILSINSNLIARSACFVTVRSDNVITTSDKAEIYMAKNEQLRVKKTCQFNSYGNLMPLRTTYEIIVSPTVSP